MSPWFSGNSGNSGNNKYTDNVYNTLKSGNKVGTSGNEEYLKKEKKC